MTRTLIVATALFLAGFSAVMFEGASATALALQSIDAAQISRDASVRDLLLKRAQSGLEQSWARPTMWHAGATEALSATFFLQGQDGHDSSQLNESVRFAERTVRLAPIAPHAWVRLARLAELGRPNSVCSLSQCLSMSWRVARMIDPPTGCERLGIAARHGLLASNDPRIDDYLASKPARADAIACLSFLPAHEAFRRVLQAHLPPTAPGARR